MVAAAPVAALAQIGDAPVQAKPSVSTLEELFNIVETLINWVLFAALLIGVLVLIVGGIRYMMAQGDEEATKKATQMVIYAIIGIAIAGLSFGIVQIIGSIFGF